MRIFRSHGEFTTPISSFAIATSAICSQFTFSLPFFRCRSTTRYHFRLCLAIDVISANDGPFSDPLMPERFRDLVLTIFAFYACDSVSRSTEVT